MKDYVNVGQLSMQAECTFKLNTVTVFGIKSRCYFLQIWNVINQYALNAFADILPNYSLV